MEFSLKIKKIKIKKVSPRRVSQAFLYALTLNLLEFGMVSGEAIKESIMIK